MVLVLTKPLHSFDNTVSSLLCDRIQLRASHRVVLPQTDFSWVIQQFTSYRLPDWFLIIEVKVFLSGLLLVLTGYCVIIVRASIDFQQNIDTNFNGNCIICTVILYRNLAIIYNYCTYERENAKWVFHL